MHLDTLAALNRGRDARQAAVLVTHIATFNQRLVTADLLDSDPLSEVLVDRLRIGASGLVEVGGQRYFLAVQTPPVRLVVIGAVHVSQALAVMAKLAGLDVTIIDPRSAFASPERFPDVRVVPQWPDQALPTIGLDRFTGLAALTHDPRIDDPALLAALNSSCFYVGALGSRKTHAARRERLLAQGITGAAFERINAPIGLDIGAVSPAEIAVSILAEVVAALRRKPRRAETAQREGVA